MTCTGRQKVLCVVIDYSLILLLHFLDMIEICLIVLKYLFA